MQRRSPSDPYAEQQQLPRYLDLSFNKLSGTISADWGRWHNLTFLGISNNNIT
ncbi:unnamed protein product, partial [Musa acuminata var. zebrina]